MRPKQEKGIKEKDLGQQQPQANNRVPGGVRRHQKKKTLE